MGPIDDVLNDVCLPPPEKQGWCRMAGWLRRRPPDHQTSTCRQNTDCLQSHGARTMRPREQRKRYHGAPTCRSHIQPLYPQARHPSEPVCRV